MQHFVNLNPAELNVLGLIAIVHLPLLIAQTITFFFWPTIIRGGKGNIELSVITARLHISVAYVNRARKASSVIADVSLEMHHWHMIKSQRFMSNWSLLQVTFSTSHFLRTKRFVACNHGTLPDWRINDIDTVPQIINKKENLLTKYLRRQQFFRTRWSKAYVSRL